MSAPVAAAAGGAAAARRENELHKDIKRVFGDNAELAYEISVIIRDANAGCLDIVMFMLGFPFMYAFMMLGSVIGDSMGIIVTSSLAGPLVLALVWLKLEKMVHKANQNRLNEYPADLVDEVRSFLDNR